MPRLVVHLNQKQNLPLTGGDLTFNLDRVQNQNVIRGKVLHVQEMHLLVNAAIKLTANGTAVAGLDLPHLLTSIFLQREASDPSSIMLNNIPGEVVFLEEVRAAGGLIPRSLTSDTSATAATYAKSFKVIVRFDEPADIAVDNGVWPLAAFANGALRVTVGNIATVWGDSNLSLDSTGTNNLDIDLICTTKDRARPGADVRWEMINAQASDNASVTGLRFPEGRYDLIMWCPKRTANGGGDNASKVSEFSGVNGGQPLAFPPSRTAADYNEDWFRAGGYLALLQSTSPIGTGKCAILKATPPGRGKWQEIFQARKPWFLDITTSSNLSNFHRFLIKRIFAPRKDEDARIAERVGIKGRFTARPKTADGRPVATRSRAMMLPRELHPAE